MHIKIFIHKNRRFYINSFITERWLNYIIFSKLNAFDIAMWFISKLSTGVEGDQKAPFSIATTPRCRRGGATPFLGLLHFTLDPYLIMLSVKQWGIKYHFSSLWYDSTWDWTQVFRAIGERSNHHANVRWFILGRIKKNLQYFGN